MGTIYRWNTTTGSYTTAANWSPASVPGSDDFATIDLTGAVVTDSPGSAFIVGLASNGSLLLSNAATLDILTTVQVIVGSSAGAAGSLSITSGAHLVDQDGTAGDIIGSKALSSGAVTITGPTSSWLTPGQIFVGLSGSAALTIANGGTVSATSLGNATGRAISIGTTASSSGILTVTGPGSVLDAAGRIGTGVNGTGLLSVLNGATVAVTAATPSNAEWIYAAGNAGASGTIVVSGAGSVLNAGGGAIGVGVPNTTSGPVANGTLIVSNGGSIAAGGSIDLSSNAGLEIGGDTIGAGSFLLTGAGSSASIIGQMNVGDTGSGTAIIQGGAHLTAGDATHATSGGISVANAVGGSGSLLITGIGTMVQSEGRFAIGRSGPGSLTVSGGAVVMSSGNPNGGGISMSIGAASVASGFATVTGVGSMVELAAGLAVGGGGSTLATGGGLQATPGGAGALTVANSGVVTVAGGATIFAAGSVSLAGGSFETDTLSLIAGGIVSGAGTVTGAIGDGGLITASGGTLGVSGSVSGGGTLAIAAGAVMDVAGAIGAGVTVNFGGAANKTLQLGAAGAMAGTLANLAVGDTIDLLGLTAGNASPVNGSLTVVLTGAQVGQTLSFQLAGNSALSFATNPDGATGTDIVVTASQPGSLPDVSGSFTSAVDLQLAAVVAALIPSGTTSNVVSVAGGGSAGAPVGGSLNALVVTSATNGSTIALPTGFEAGYLLAAATLQDTIGGAVLIDAAAGGSLIGAANDTLFGGNAGGSLFATTGAETLVGGTGSTDFFLGASTAVVASQGSDIITGSSAAETVNASGSALYFGTSGATTFNASGTGGDTIIGGNNGNTVQGGGGGQLIFGSSTLNYTGGAGAATIIGGGGGNTVAGGSGTLLLFASGSMTYTGNGGAATVIGGGGPLNANLGAGGGTAYGSPFGGNTLSTSSSTASILVGGGSGDVLSATGSGADILVAGGGSETLNGSGATGNLVIFGGPGSDILAGGTGNDLFVAEPGNETLTGGGGTNSYVFIDAGSTARTDVITDFNPNTDAIGLFGYGAEPGADAAALASATVSGGNTVVTLSDGTSIQFTGAPTLQSYNFF